MYLNRSLEKVIMEMSNAFPVVLVTGPRQVGKTTMLKALAAKSRKYVTLDNPMIRDLAIRDPELFIQRYEPPVLIDEIQYVPELLPFIKMYVDEHKSKGDFWITGSQMFHLMKNVSESLAGRVGIANMLGLSYSELIQRDNLPFCIDVEKHMKRVVETESLSNVYKRIFKGSMPSLYETEQNIEQYYASYVETYLQRDVKDLTQVADSLAFMKFMQACAARTSHMVNYTELAKDVGISSPTAKHWLSILVSSGIIALVEPYYNNALKRIIKAPNLYFLDTGLCAYLTRWTSPETLEVSAMSGAFFETYVVSEVIKSYYNAGKRPPIYYYRDSDQREIDLIIERDQTLYPVEIKKSASPKTDAIRHFGLLSKAGFKLGVGSVICLSQDMIPIDRENYFVPVSCI